MSKMEKTFSFYILLVELVTKGVFKLLWILVFGRLKLKIAQLKKNFNGSDFVASHMFLSATAWDLGRSLFEKKRLSKKIVWWNDFLALFKLAENKVLICFFGCCLKRHFDFLFFFKRKLFRRYVWSYLQFDSRLCLFQIETCDYRHKRLMCEQT